MSCPGAFTAAAQQGTAVALSWFHDTVGPVCGLSGEVAQSLARADVLEGLSVPSHFPLLAGDHPVYVVHLRHSP